MKTTSNQRKIVKEVVVSCAFMAHVPFKEINNDILSIMMHDYTMLPMPIYISCRLSVRWNEVLQCI